MTDFTSQRRAGLPKLLLILLGLDALLTWPFLFQGPAEMDTLRYALGLHRWVGGQEALSTLFNAEMSFGYYLGLNIWQRAFDSTLASLPDLLNRVSALSGILCVGAFFMWWRRWWDERVAFRLTLLLIATPAFWSLQLYGNTNVAGLALAALAVSLLPSAEVDRGRAVRWLAVWVLGTAALTVRTDVLMIAPAVLAYLVWGRDRPSAKSTVVAGAGCVLTFFLLRLFVLDSPSGGGAFLRHWDSNLSLSDPAWIGRTVSLNVVSLVTESPPLTLLVSGLCFLAIRGRDGRSVRWTTLLWLSPALLFLAFTRVHVARILIPLLPAALLPLAYWASLSRRRDLLLAIVVVLSHVSMMFLPGLEKRLGRASAGTGRVSHYLSHQGMFRDHLAIQNDTTELIEDGTALLREEGDGRRAVVVIGGDVLIYEYLLLVAHPGTMTESISQSYGVQLRTANVPGWDHPWYFLYPRWDRDPEEILGSAGVPAETLRHFTPWEKRARGL